MVSWSQVFLMAPSGQIKVMRSLPLAPAPRRMAIREGVGASAQLEGSPTVPVLARTPAMPASAVSGKTPDTSIMTPLMPRE